MQYLIGYTLSMVLIVSAILLFMRPSIALGLLMTLYSSEQIIMRTFPFFVKHQSAYNYIIGVICIVAIIVSLFRSGFPKINLSLPILYLCLLFLGWSSLLWTRAPNAAQFALIHFTLEGSLAIFLPFFVIRRFEDFSYPFLLAIVIASLSSISLIVTPVMGGGGRTILLEGSGPLSNAELIGVSMIFLSAGNSSTLGSFSQVRLPLLALSVVGVFLTGARMQFVISLILCSVIIVLISREPFKRKVFGLSLFTLIIFILGYVASDLLSSTFEHRFSINYIKEAFSARLSMIFIPLGSVLDNILFGKGLMGWAYDVFDMDTYSYPHNSIFQVFYELGIVGLFIFVSIILSGFRLMVKSYKKLKMLSIEYSLGLSISAYFLYSFLLSLKQGSFMSCLGIYMGASCLFVYHGFLTSSIRSTDTNYSGMPIVVNADDSCK